MTIVQCYAPTNVATPEEKDLFYDKLRSVVEKVPRHDVLIVMGDMNAVVGKENAGFEQVMGRHGCGEMNDNGERLVDFCLDSGLVVGGTLFQHREIHKLTWRSPGGDTINQIDHITINGRWRRSLRDVRVWRGADVFSDHLLVVGSLRLGLRKTYGKRSCRLRYDVNRLRCPKVQKEFSDRLKSGLRESGLKDQVDGPQEKWDVIRDAYCKAAEATLKCKGVERKEWITDETWKAVDERRTIKAKLLHAKSERIRSQVQKEYSAKDREVKRNARKDKRAFVEQLAEEADKAAKRGDLSATHKITNRLCGARARTTVVRGTDGSLLSTAEEQASRWVEHFRSVLNQKDPEVTNMPSPAEGDLEVNTQAPTELEIRDAIKTLKNRKAAGPDSIQGEMLKADTSTSVWALHDLFKSIWDKEEIPTDWTRGLIVKLPKKGDLSVCDNWRGITLLSIPSKVFCRVIFNRIYNAVDQRLRKEQAGFRRGRGCIDQIFALRNILEQCIEWNAPLLVNFIDFKKAFDSIHRDTLWAVLRSYGIPEKIVKLIKLFYEHFECGVILLEGVSEYFEVKTGVRQGCILSPLLFLTLIDLVMRRTTNGMRRGIHWGSPLGTECLEDLDFADDIAVLSCTEQHMREKTAALRQHAGHVGLEISTEKTKMLCINKELEAPINVGDKSLECIDSFTYLGSVISKNGGAREDIRSRLAKARGVFSKLKTVWKSSSYSLRTKLHLYSSLVKTVLLYGSECWRVTEADFHKLEVFHNGCLRRIMRIFWPNVVSNEDLHAKARTEPISITIKRRRLKWLGHVLRMPANQIPRVALFWTPQGKRNAGRPKMTWRRTVEKELMEMKLTWRQAGDAAKDRTVWRTSVDALCSKRSGS
jgi:hypothetical protein